MGGALCTVLDLLEWFPNNVACNSLMTVSNFEFTSLELQRLWGVLKTDRRELHATFVWTRRACAAGAHAASAHAVGAHAVVCT